MSEKKTMFKSLKVGMKVKDAWYGRGTVKKLSARRAHILMRIFSEVWVYDIQHVNHFITKDKS